MTAFAKLLQLKGMKPAITILGAALILLVPAILNGFPFIFSDSGDYLVFTPLLYRSPYYGLFIFFFHLNRWIWLPVFAQALIVSHLLWKMLTLSGRPASESTSLLLAVLLTVFSSAPYFVGFIMADIFTPVMLIAMYILAFHYAGLTRAERIYFVLLDCIATAAHVTNLTIAALILAFTALILLWSAREKLRGLHILTIPIGLTAAAILLFNMIIFHLFALVPAGSCYLMANLIEYGPARSYLEQSCPQAGYKICRYTNQLPQTADELLWTSGLFQKLGGFVSMKSECSIIVEATITHDATGTVAVIGKNFVAGLMLHEPAIEFRKLMQVSSMISLLNDKFGPDTLAAYRGSAEMRDTIPHALIRYVDSIVTPASFLILAGMGLLASWRKDRQEAALAAFMLFAVLENTLLCAGFSGLHDRYQARVSWLLPMTVFIMAYNSLMKSRKTAQRP